MATQKKIETVEEYSEKFKSSKSIFLADYSGINVDDTNTLRRSFRAADVEYRIVKNSLAKRSLSNAGIEGLDTLLEGMTAFAFSDNDPIAPINVIKEFNKSRRKDDSKLDIKGCFFEGSVISPEEVEELSNLPSREVLIAQLLGMLQAPLSKFMSALEATGQKFVTVLEQIKNTKPE